jgi:predicted MFS family arabinose efflux permease
MSEVQPSRSAEWRAHWPIVLLAFVGFSFPSMVINTVGLVIQPVSQEFGWSRAQFTVGVSIASALAVPLSPITGAVLDRWGVRRIALPGALITGLAIAAISLADGSLWRWIALWACYGLATQMVTSTIWTAAVTRNFTAARSMALGVALCGTSFAAAVTPPLTQWLADDYGWRTAYLVLGATWGVATFILCVLFLFDDPATRAPKPGDSPAEPAERPPGLSVAEAARSLPLLRIALATLITLTLGSALLVHKVPILTEAGVTRENAALLTSLSGLAAITGKIVTGWLMERFDAGWIGGLTNAITAIALLFLLEPFRTPTLIVVSMLFVGYAGGTKLQICAYLTGVYAGMRNFGKVFGAMTSMIALAASLGPLIGGVAYDLSGDYAVLIWIAIPASLVSGLLLIRLGAYPEWSRNLASKRSRSSPPPVAATSSS